MRIALGGRQVMVTLLRNDLVHVAYNDQGLSPGMPYFSPMLAVAGFAGPATYAYDAATHRLSSPDIAVELDGACWRITNIAGPQAQLMTRLCVNDWNPDSLRLGVSAEANTEVFGLGQQLLTSHTKPSWMGEQRNTGNKWGNLMNPMSGSDIGGTGNTQVPVAYVLGQGMRNYGMFFDTPYALQFDLRGANWQVSSSKASLGLFFFTGPDLADLRRDYLTLTGTPPVPPLKAFGLWLSEYGFDNWGELDGKLSSLRQNGFPIDGAVLDLQWFGGIRSDALTAMGSLSWNTVKFPDPAAKIAAYAAGGLGIVTIEESYIGANLPEHQQLASLRYLAMNCPPPCTTPIRLTANPWWGVGGMVDWSNTTGASFWHNAKRKALIDDGILGHWTDLGEPEDFDSRAWYEGIAWYGVPAQRHRDIHNLYNFFWNRSIAVDTARTHPSRRPWILSRSGTAGSQRYGVAMWSGDVASSFDTLGAQMNSQANMSLSGFDYYGSDVGGFHRGVFGSAFDTLYTRWLVTSALLDVPVRPHTENLCNCKETAPDRVGDRASNLAALRLRYQLAPYLYSLAHQAYGDGQPVFPPLVYHFQDDAQARAVATTKMIGPWLLFTALTNSAATVQTYLPSGSWADFLDPSQVLGSAGAFSTRQVVRDGLVRAPLFLREGAIVPMWRQAPEHLAIASSAPQIQWFSDLLIRTYPKAAETSFVLHEDDGFTRAYETGVLARTTISAQRPSAGKYRVALAPDNRTGAKATRTLSVEVVTGADTIGQVSVDGVPLGTIKAGDPQRGWYAQAGMVHVQLGSVDVSAATVLLLGP